MMNPLFNVFHISIGIYYFNYLWEIIEVIGVGPCRFWLFKVISVIFLLKFSLVIEYESLSHVMCDIASTHPRTDLDDHLVSAEDDGVGQQCGEHGAHADEGPQLQDSYV